MCSGLFVILILLVLALVLRALGLLVLLVANVVVLLMCSISSIRKRSSCGSMFAGSMFATP